MKRHTSTLGCIEDSGEYAAVKAEAPQHGPYWMLIAGILFAVALSASLLTLATCSKG